MNQKNEVSALLLCLQTYIVPLKKMFLAVSLWSKSRNKSLFMRTLKTLFVIKLSGGEVLLQQKLPNTQEKSFLHFKNLLPNYFQMKQVLKIYECWLVCLSVCLSMYFFNQRKQLKLNIKYKLRSITLVLFPSEFANFSLDS